jgi:ADP-ribosyl-[dinitrogen reductase] hydrolase
MGQKGSSQVPSSVIVTGLSDGVLTERVNPASVDQYKYAMLGLAVGDALGMVVEGSHSGRTKEFVEYMQIQFAADQTKFDIGDYGRVYGQYTDDTQLARELMISIQAVATERKSKEEDANESKIAIVEEITADFAKRISTLYSEHKVLGCGMATAKAMTKLIQGEHYTASGSDGEGNSPAPRTLPVSLFFWSDSTLRNALILMQTRTTHKSHLCVASSIVYGHALHLTLKYEPPEAGKEKEFATAFLQRLKSDLTAQPMAEDNSQLANSMLRMMEFLDEFLAVCAKELEPQDAASEIAQIGLVGTHKKHYRPADGVPGFIVSTVLWSLYCFCRHPLSAFDALKLCISVGGDTDSNGACTGALSGAFLGSQANLPSVLMSSLHDKDTWKADELSTLCESIHQLQASPSTS